jgi:hypothetical protein
VNCWLVVDVHAVAWLEFHGAARRDPAAAIAGTVSRVLDTARRNGCLRNIVWAFDAGPYNRALTLPGYKSTREAKRKQESPEAADQTSALRTALGDTGRKYLSACGVSNVLYRKGFEADDHIAAVASRIPKTDRVIVYSRDKDLYQLLRRNVVQMDPHTGTVTTLDDFRTEYGVHPAQWAEVKALAGCATDDVPGADGIGDVMAARYVLGTLPETSSYYAKAHSWVQRPEYLRNLILCRLPFSGCPAHEPEEHEPYGPENWKALFESLGFAGAERLLEDKYSRRVR